MNLLKMKKQPFQFEIVHQIKKRRWLLIVVLVATIHLFCQTLMLPYGTALLSLLPGQEKGSHFTRISNADTLDDEFQKESLEFVEDVSLGEAFVEEISEPRHELLSVDLSNNLGVGNSINSSISNEDVKTEIVMVENVKYLSEPDVNKSGDGLQARILPINEKYLLFQSDGKKQFRCLMPPKTVMYNDQMNRLLVRHRTSSRAMVWVSNFLNFFHNFVSMSWCN